LLALVGQRACCMSDILLGLIQSLLLGRHFRTEGLVDVFKDGSNI
jgi:hypothetical protein